MVVLLAGWFLLVSPQRASADDIATQADSQVSANQLAENKIKALKLEYQNLPTLQAELAIVATHIPQAANMPGLLRTLSEAARASGVKLTSLTPANPVPLDSAGATGGLAAPGQVNVIPLTMQITGPFANTRLFMNRLEGMPRSFLVTGLTIARDSAATGSTTASTSAPGTLVSTITGRVFAANPGVPVAAPAPKPSTSTTTG